MDNVNKTMYIPLYGKALVSGKGILLADKKAEEIWAAVQFPLKKKSKSKWLAYYMAMRAVAFDDWLKGQLATAEEAIVLHLGCGLDSRVLRVGTVSCPFYDVDFPAVIEEKRKYFEETDTYRMLAADIKDAAFLEGLPTAKKAIVVMEGISMYLSKEERATLLGALTARFEKVALLVDCYSPFSAKMSKIKNPIKDVGVTDVYGVKGPQALAEGTGLTFVKEHDITPKNLIEQLEKKEQKLFKWLYAGKMARSLYRLYEYEK